MTGKKKKTTKLQLTISTILIVKPQARQVVRRITQLVSYRRGEFVCLSALRAL